MQWKRHTLKIALITYSMILSCLFTAPGIAFSAELLDAKKLTYIESVMSTGDGLATELSVKLTSPATYTTYKTTSPLRLIIDFSQVTQGNIPATVNINKGNFKSVTTSRYDTDAGVLTRVEIELIHDSEAVILASPTNPGELKISFPLLAESALSEVKKDSVVRDNFVEPLPSTPVFAALPNTEDFERTLTDISVKNNAVVLAIDRTIGEFNTFRLSKPERYVIDLMNVRSGLSARLLPLNASGVASARIGLYPDKVRVVLDSVNGTFPEASSAITVDGIVITLDAKPIVENSHTKLTSVYVEKPIVKPLIPLEAKLEARQEEVTKPVTDNKLYKDIYTPKPAAGVSTVEMIDFQIVDGVSRVSIKVSGNINAEQPVKTPGYVTLTIKDSILPKKLQRSIETSSFISPVLRITPFSVNTKKSTNSKIRIASRIDVPFEYRQEGDMLFIDFKHPAGMMANKLFIEATDSRFVAPPQKTSQVNNQSIPLDISSPDYETDSKPYSSLRNYRGRKVTLEFADAEVRKIFQLLSEVSNKNFVLGDEVTGAISLKLVNVPWDQALDIILDTKGLDKREDGNIIIIKGKGKFKSQAEEDLEIKKLAAKSIELKTETFSVNYADLGAITSQFEKIKTPDRGQISSDSRTSKVIVKDTPQALSDMRSLLLLLDMPEKQVMIEARIVEATSTFSRNLGVNWGVHVRDGSASFLGINSLDTGFGGLTSSVPPTSGVGAGTGGSMGISFGTLGSNIKLDMRLNAAASAGLVKIVSTPKVATLNNKTAKITQGQQIPYTASTSDKVETKFIEAALSLEVTPHINANGTISMKIDAKNDSPGAGGDPPPINKKQATTEMLLRDGETTVIGGIYIDSDQESDDGVPYLMDIPFLGKLFKTNMKSKTKTELLIFITPRILGAI